MSINNMPFSPEVLYQLPQNYLPILNHYQLPSIVNFCKSYPYSLRPEIFPVFRGNPPDGSGSILPPIFGYYLPVLRYNVDKCIFSAPSVLVVTSK